MIVKMIEISRNLTEYTLNDTDFKQMNYLRGQRKNTQKWIDSLPNTAPSVSPHGRAPFSKVRDLNWTSPLKRTPEMHSTSKQNKSVEDFAEEVTRLRKEMVTQRSRADASALKCKKLERNVAKQNEEFQSTLAALSTSNSQQTSGGKHVDLLRIINHLKRRMLTLEQQLEEKNSKLKSMQGDVRRTKMEEMNGQMEAAYSEIERLQRLVTVFQERQKLWADANTDKLHIARQSPLHLQNAALQKALRILYSEKKVIEETNAELLRQAKACRSYYSGKVRNFVDFHEGLSSSSINPETKPSNNLPSGAIVATHLTKKRHKSKGRSRDETVAVNPRQSTTCRTSENGASSNPQNVNVVHLEHEGTQRQMLEKQYLDSLAQINAQRKLIETASKSSPRLSTPREVALFPIANSSPSSPRRELSPPKDLGGPVIFPIVSTSSPRSPPLRIVTHSQVFESPPEPCHECILSEENAAIRIQQAWRRHVMEDKMQRSKPLVSNQRTFSIEKDEVSGKEDGDFLNSILEDYFSHQGDEDSF